MANSEWKVFSYNIEITQVWRRTVIEPKSFITKEVPTEIEFVGQYTDTPTG